MNCSNIIAGISKFTVYSSSQYSVQILNRSVEVLRRRVAELEAVESRLLSSQTQVKHLQHQLRICRQDAHFVESMKDKIMCCEDFQHRVQLLMEENQSLQKDRVNADLLRYQVQSLQQRCDNLEGVLEEVQGLRLENSQLKEGETKGQQASFSALQIRLAEFQQREVVSVSKFGELSSQ